MHRRILTTTVVFSLGILIAKAREADADLPQGSAEKRIAALVRNLDANEYAVREAASAELLKIGELAVPAIKAALADRPTVEVRARAERLIREIIVWGDIPHELSLPALSALLQETFAAKDPAKVCRDGRLERQLDGWVRILTQVGGRHGGRLPVSIAEVKFAESAQRGDEADAWRRSLLVVKGGRINRAFECVIIADGPILIDQADRCIVLARSVVSLNQCRNSVVVAGQVVDASDSTGNILIAGSQVLFDGASDTIAAAETAIASGSNTGVILVNSRFDDESLPEGVRTAKLPELHFGDHRTKTALVDNIQLLETLWQGDRVARVRVAGGKDQIIHCGETLMATGGDRTGKPDRWTLCFAKSDMALFSNGDNYAILRVKR